MNILQGEQINYIGEYIIDKDKILGKGQYSIVYDCRHPQIKEDICAKIFKTNYMDNRKVIQQLEILSELKQVNNPNLVGIYHVIPVPEKKDLYIIMEQYKGGDLKQEIERRALQDEPYSISEIISIIAQIINAYKTLFDRKIIHRDLRPSNILIQNGKIKVQITEFRMIRVIDVINKKYEEQVGTPAYKAPQIYFENKYSSKSDIYSLGIILYQLVFLKVPFTCSSMSGLILSLKQLKEQPFKCKEITLKGDPKQQDMIRKLIDQMITYNEEQRISLEKLFEIFCTNRVENINFLQIPLYNELLKDDSIFIHNFSFVQQINPKLCQQVAVNKWLSIYNKIKKQQEQIDLTIQLNYYWLKGIQLLN